MAIVSQRQHFTRYSTIAPGDYVFHVEARSSHGTWTLCLGPWIDDVAYLASSGPPNEFQHARARQIEVEIRYDDRVLRLRIRDDGKGIDAKVLQEGGRAGHWGLPGIRERAKQIGAQLDFWSEAGAGTEIELTVPAAVAYAKLRDAGGFKLFRKRTGTHAH